MFSLTKKWKKWGQTPFPTVIVSLARNFARCSRTSFAAGVNSPIRTSFEYAFSPATARPSVSASSHSNPSRSATTAAHSVSTGAQLIEIVRVVIGVRVDFLLNPD